MVNFMLLYNQRAYGGKDGLYGLNMKMAMTMQH